MSRISFVPHHAANHRHQWVFKPTFHEPKKPKASLRSFLCYATFAVLAAPSLQAITYYWDNNGDTAGFGTATGTWAAPTTGDATQGWSISDTGALLPVDVTTTTADIVNFGTNTVGKDTAPGFDTVTLVLPLSDPGKFARLKVTP